MTVTAPPESSNLAWWDEIHELSMTMSLVLARPMVTREAERSKSTAWLLPGLKMRRAMVRDRWRIIEQQLIWQVVLPRVGGERWWVDAV